MAAGRYFRHHQDGGYQLRFSHQTNPRDVIVQNRRRKFTFLVDRDSIVDGKFAEPAFGIAEGGVAHRRIHCGVYAAISIPG